MMRLLERVLCLMLVSAASLRPFDKHISTPAVNHIENGLPRIYRKITRILAAGALLYQTCVPCHEPRKSHVSVKGPRGARVDSDTPILKNWSAGSTTHDNRFQSRQAQATSRPKDQIPTNTTQATRPKKIHCRGRRPWQKKTKKTKNVQDTQV